MSNFTFVKVTFIWFKSTEIFLFISVFKTPFCLFFFFLRFFLGFVVDISASGFVVVSYPEDNFYEVPLDVRVHSAVESSSLEGSCFLEEPTAFILSAIINYATKKIISN